MTQQEYIQNWHDLFVKNVSGALGYIAGVVASGDVSEKSREKLTIAKLFLEGEDIRDVESDLAMGTVDDETLDKTEIVYVKIAEFIIDMTVQAEETKRIMKDFAKRFEHYQKEFTRLQLDSMRKLE